MDGRQIWRALRSRLRDERSELRAARQHITATDLVCDIGANKGSYLFWLSRWAGRVVAFEPQPGLAAYLRRMYGARPNVTIEAKGVYSKNGDLDLYVPNPGSPAASLVKGEGYPLKVPVIALDDYFQPEERVAFLKVDVEGAELGVFQGASRILQRSRPILLFESEARHCPHEIHETFQFLKIAGYTGRFFSRGRMKPIEEFDVKVHQSQIGDRYWNRSDYCNNFFFIPNS